MILRAAWVAPVAAPPLPDGAIRVLDGTIAAVGPAQALTPAPGEVVRELGDVLLTPGLVNPHTHLELTCYAGQLAPAALWDWLPALVQRRRAPGQMEREHAAVRVGALQSLAAGVTCVGDISRCGWHAEVLRPLPIRKVCFFELLALADHPPRTVAELRAGVAGVPQDERLRVGVSPHAPYTVSAGDIRRALELAAEFGLPWCMHWAETTEEVAFVAGALDALPPWLADLVRKQGWSSPRRPGCELLEEVATGLPAGLLAHCNYATAQDAERIAAAGHTVVYCPRAHRFFGHPRYPLRELRAAGVRVALGTDSAASNDDLDPRAEGRLVLEQFPELLPGEVLAMITRDAAESLGLGEEVGTLDVGRWADLAAFPVEVGAHGAGDEVLAAFFRETRRPTGVWVAGEEVRVVA